PVRRRSRRTVNRARPRTSPPRPRPPPRARRPPPRRCGRWPAAPGGVPRRRRLLRGIGTVESLTGFLRSQGCADLLPVVQVVFDAGDLLHGLVATPGDEYCIRRSGL